MSTQLQASGAISFGNLFAVFSSKSAVKPLKLSTMYYGGAVVPSGTKNAGVPSSGAIKMSNFYNATSVVFENLANSVIFNDTNQYIQPFAAVASRSGASVYVGSSVTYVEFYTNNDYTGLLYTYNGNSATTLTNIGAVGSMTTYTNIRDSVFISDTVRYMNYGTYTFTTPGFFIFIAYHNVQSVGLTLNGSTYIWYRNGATGIVQTDQWRSGAPWNQGGVGTVSMQIPYAPPPTATPVPAPTSTPTNTSPPASYYHYYAVAALLGTGRWVYLEGISTNSTGAVNNFAQAEIDSGMVFNQTSTGINIWPSADNTVINNSSSSIIRSGTYNLVAYDPPYQVNVYNFDAANKPNNGNTYVVGP